MPGLNLGTLTGYLELDESGVGEAVNRALDHVQRFARKGVVIAGAAGLAIAGAIGTSIAEGMDLEAGRDKLAAELGLSEAESARVGKIAGQLFAQNYGDSMEGVNEAVSSVMTSIDGMRNASSKDLQAVTIDALNFAKVFDIDINRAAQVAGQAVKNGLARNAGEAFDLLITASQRVPKALREDFLDASDEYAQFFDTLGYSGKEAFALLVEASDKGMYGIDKAGDAIKEFTIRSTDMSTLSKQAYKAIGLDANDMANDILAGGDRAHDATQKVIDGLLGIKDPAKQANMAIALFGTPIEDLNTAEIPAFLKSLKGGSDAMDGFGGAAKRMDTTLNDNATASLATLRRQAVVAFYTLGNWAIPKVNQISASLSANFGPALLMVIGILRRLVAGAQSTFGFIASHDTTFKIIAGVILTLLIPALISMGVQATISAAKMVAGWVASAAGAAATAALSVASHTLIVAGWVRSAAVATASAARTAAAWLISKAGVAGTIALYGVAFAMMAAGWIASAAASMAGAVVMAAAWFIALGPIGWAIAAIALIVALVIRYWDQISEFTREAWSKISGLVSGAVSWVIGFVKEHWPLILAIITGPIGLAVLVIARNMDRIKGAMSAAWNAVKSGARAAWSGVTGIISNGAATVVNAVRAIPGKLLSLVGRFASAGRSIINAFVGGLKNAGGTIGGIAGSVWNAVKGLLNGAIDKINSALEFKISIPAAPDVHVNPPNIPHLAKGGYADDATLAVFGEAGPEVALPLDDPKAKQAMADAFGTTGGNSDELAAELRELIEETRELADAMRDVAERPIDLSVDGRQAGRIVAAGDRDRKR